MSLTHYSSEEPGTTWAQRRVEAEGYNGYCDQETPPSYTYANDRKGYRNATGDTLDEARENAAVAVLEGDR